MVNVETLFDYVKFGCFGAQIANSFGIIDYTEGVALAETSLLKKPSEELLIKMET